MVTAAMKLTDACSLEGSDDTYRQCMGSEITLLANVPAVTALVFPVVMTHGRAAPSRKLSAEELMLSNCAAGKDSYESLGLRGDPTSPS